MSDFLLNINSKFFTPLEKKFAEVECFSEVMGKVPFLGIVGGMVRGCLGVSQIIGGLAIPIIALVAFCYEKIKGGNHNQHDGSKAILKRVFYIPYGFLNVGRAVSEIFSFMTYKLNKWYDNTTMDSAQVGFFCYPHERHI